ncbi:MAG: iron-sulfur cluster assembly protein, partial [Geminicoccaceae bacterium]
MAEAITKERILEELKRVKGPDLSENIVAMGLVSEIVLHKGKVYFAIKVDPDRAQELEPLRLAAQKVVEELPGVETAAVTLTADRPSAGGNGSGLAPAAPAGPPPGEMRGSAMAGGPMG